MCTFADKSVERFECQGSNRKRRVLHFLLLLFSPVHEISFLFCLRREREAEKKYSENLDDYQSHLELPITEAAATAEKF